MDATLNVPPTSHITYDGVILNTYTVNKGQGLAKHEHVYSHLTYCHRGSMIVRKEGIERILKAGDPPFNLKPNEWHELEAAEDNTIFQNVFAEGKVG